MARVAIQNRGFLTVRLNSNPTTVPRLWRLSGERLAGVGAVDGAGLVVVVILGLRQFVLFAVDADEDLLQGDPFGGEAADPDVGVDEFAQDRGFRGAVLGCQVSGPGAVGSNVVKRPKLAARPRS